SASTSGAMPLLKSCAIRPVANTQRPAFMPCANLTFPGPSSTGSSGSAFLSAIPIVLVSRQLRIAGGQGEDAFGPLALARHRAFNSGLQCLASLLQSDTQDQG